MRLLSRGKYGMTGLGTYHHAMLFQTKYNEGKCRQRSCAPIRVRSRQAPRGNSVDCALLEKCRLDAPYTGRGSSIVDGVSGRGILGRRDSCAAVYAPRRHPERIPGLLYNTEEGDDTWLVYRDPLSIVEVEEREGAC